MCMHLIWLQSSHDDLNPHTGNVFVNDTGNGGGDVKLNPMQSIQKRVVIR